MNRINKSMFGLTVGLLAVFTMAADCNGDSSSTQTTAQDATQQVGKRLKVGKDYPFNQMHFPTAEQSNDWERTLRMNNPNKIGYLTVITQSGQVIANYTIKGKFSSTSSQLLNTQDVTDCGSNCGSVVSSVGDDGTYGDEECGPTGGIFFFTPADVLKEICPGSSTVIYSDAPQNLVTKPVLNENASVGPSTSTRNIPPQAENLPTTSTK